MALATSALTAMGAVSISGGNPISVREGRNTVTLQSCLAREGTVRSKAALENLRVRFSARRLRLYRGASSRLSQPQRATTSS